jgi:hypothetical protein
MSTEDHLIPLAEAQLQRLRGAIANDGVLLKPKRRSKAEAAALAELTALGLVAADAEREDTLIITEAGRDLIGLADRDDGDLANGGASEAELITRPDSAGPPQTEVREGDTGGPAPTGKLGMVVEMLRRPQGVTVEALSEATGWQVHSVRGAMSGTLKKKHGLTITSEKVEGVRRYRIASASEAQA